MNVKEIIAERAAKEVKDGDVVNLGIGLPTLVSNYISSDVHIILHSENGILGTGTLSSLDERDKDVINAGGQFVNIVVGASYFDSATSFGIIRGGHIDVAILGALQVDEQGSLASHIIPGKMVSGMGGAMDLVVGAKKVIVATTHTANGKSKLVKKLAFPVTAINKVHKIITELAVIEISKQGFVLKEIAEGVSIKDVISKTDAELIISRNLKRFAL